jgi:hypothetical protein
MAIESRYSVYGGFRTARYSKLYWLNIDVTLRDIFFQQGAERNRIIRHQQPLSLEYCVLEGLGAVANVLTVGLEGMDFDRFLVDITGYVDDEANHSIYELRPTGKMIWSKTNERSPRLDIYIPNNLSRHLIELYVTKRIDRVQLSIQIAVIGDQAGNLNGLPDGFPLVSEADHLFFRRVQCELLSVYTSIGKN